MSFVSRRLLIGSVVAAFVLAIPLLACGDDPGAGNDRSASCVTLCQESQAGNCTAIKGDCSAFCSAVDSTAPKASCVSQRDAYRSCLNSKENACQASCNGPERTLTNCLLPYCQQNSAQPDCKTLIASY
jgi:hypothetical protein